ncbi:hypothetical protein K502DRAFT_348614 [Neoconidiobolus thromboides FSU 785]|nr:hypothetical protein K502DRAFT_348614 [Neoconidiobolus thromboides FSU 785]
MCSNEFVENWIDRKERSGIKSAELDQSQENYIVLLMDESPDIELDKLMGNTTNNTKAYRSLKKRSIKKGNVIKIKERSNWAQYEAKFRITNERTVNIIGAIIPIEVINVQLLEIKAYIAVREYNHICLPLGLGKLYPIGPFWSYFKTKVKREILLKEKTITSRIKQDCENTLISGLSQYIKASCET